MRAGRWTSRSGRTCAPSWGFALLLSVLLATPLAAQSTDSTRSLPTVDVTASPFALVPSRAPVALSVRERTDAERATDPAASLDALGRGLPGVWISDRGSVATGERVLVRGLGWRAAFGVRGTHVILDGVPLTLADGQSALDVVDAGLVRRVEAIRGPASTEWGSGSAGVLAFTTSGDAPGATARAVGGAYGQARLEASATPSLAPGQSLSVWGSAMRQDGFRDHSAARRLRGGLSGSADLGGGRTVGVVALGAALRAQAPGGITQDAADDDPRQTRDIVIESDARKSLAQGHLALTLAQPLGPATLRTTAAVGGRSLDNPIVPRVIEIDRRTASLRVVAESRGVRRLAWGLGAELEAQRDDRLERSNVAGAPGPDVLTDQLETVRSGAVFGRASLDLTDVLSATAALRADALRYAATPSGASESARTVAGLSPSLGLSLRPTAGATLYANVSGALDAPTTTELGNRADGAPGFSDLAPERTWGAEVGARVARAAAGGVLRLDAAVFAARVRDLLLSAEIDDQTIFQNAGGARHRGAELGLAADGLRAGRLHLDGAAALTLTRGTFTDGPGDSEAPDGNAVPGFPPALATWTLTGRLGALVLGADGEAAAAYAADSAGAQRADGYAVLHLRLGLADVAVGPAAVTPFVSVRNVTDARYAGSVVVNAFGGRFVEPAPGRHLSAGVSVRFE